VTVASQQALRCANVVDIELTGKCVVKLCENGMIQGDTALNWRLLENGKRTGEFNWRGEERRGEERL